MSDKNLSQSTPDNAVPSAQNSNDATPAPEKRKTPLEMVRERQANMQAARRGAGKKGGKNGESGSAAHGTDGASKPVQIKRQMGG